MKLVKSGWKLYDIPFRSAFWTAHGTLTKRIGALVTLQTDAGYVGYGEIAPLPEFSGTALADALRLLPKLATELPGRDVKDILLFLDSQGQDNQLPAPLLYGLETALLDVLGQACGQNIATLLANNYSAVSSVSAISPRTSVLVNAVISGETTEMAVARAEAAVAAGFTCLKLKITGASEAMLERVVRIRAAIGTVPRLRLDANESWDFAQASFMLTQCAVDDIEYVEQPLPACDLAGMARLRRVSPIPIAADEALNSLASVQGILQQEAADVLILKPQLIGGLNTCRKIIYEASKQQVDCVITSTLEAGIGVTAALHLAAASPEIKLACGLATLDLLENDLLQEKLVLNNGHMCVPVGAGLGVQLNLATLDEYGC